jgi:hypothetical protein
MRNHFKFFVLGTALPVAAALLPMQAQASPAVDAWSPAQLQRFMPTASTEALTHFSRHDVINRWSPEQLSGGIDGTQSPMPQALDATRPLVDQWAPQALSMRGERPRG